MIEITLALYSLATLFQIIGVCLAFSQIKVVKQYSYGWTCLSLGLLLMLARRIPQILAALFEAEINIVDGVLALIISLLLLIGVIGIKQFFAWVNKQDAALNQLTKFDMLTGASTRHAIIEQGLIEIERCIRLDRPLALLMLDVDHFKLINDRHGHLAGDEVLKSVVNACKTSLRSIDLFGRFGGEEFIAILPEATTEDAVAVANRINQAIAVSFTSFKDLKLQVTMSIGIASLNQLPIDSYAQNDVQAVLDNLMYKADKALYQAKSSGRNCFQLYIPALVDESPDTANLAVQLNPA